MKKNKKAYSVIIAILMVGFLLVMVIGVYNLIIKELNDNRGMGNYYKAYYGAEAGKELALLQIKEKGYGYYNKIDLTVNDDSVLLTDNPTNKSLYNGGKDVIFSYDLNSKVNSFSGNLDNLEYDIIPLFYLTGTINITEEKANNISLDLISGEQNNLVWNILSQSGGISGTGTFNNDTEITQKIQNSNGFEIKSLKINDFLQNNTNNYLIIINSGEEEVKYNLSSNDTYFTKPRTEIISSAMIGDYKQNLTTIVDNTEYLSFLKYSIYSQ